MRVLVFLSTLLVSIQSNADLLVELEKIRANESVPLLAVTTFRDGEIEHSSVLGGGTLETPLRWGSITKTFTALALSRAVRDRDIPWHASVRALVPNPPWTNPWALSDPVRVQDLANLCAGMSDLSFDEFNDNTPRPLAEALKTPRTIVWPPGLQHSYTNVTPGLTAWLVEQLTGEAFHSYIAARVLAPMGMPNASLEPVAGLPGGYKSDGATEIPYWHMTFTAFGALNASLGEISQAVLRILNGAVHVADLERLRSPGCLANGDPKLNIGYGAGHYGRVRHGFVWYGHGGDADGYRSRYALLPEQGRGYIVLINTDNPQLLRRIEQKLEKALVSDLKKPTPVLPDYSVDIAQWAGEYYPSSVRFGIERWQAGDGRRVAIEVSDKNLQLRSQSRTTRLIPVGPGVFRRENDPIATVRFIRRGDVVYLQGELGNFFKLNNCPDWYCD